MTEDGPPSLGSCQDFDCTCTDVTYLSGSSYAALRESAPVPCGGILRLPAYIKQFLLRVDLAKWWIRREPDYGY